MNKASRNLVMIAMGAVLGALLTAAVAVTLLQRSVPEEPSSTPASLCDAEEGYRLGIDGEFLAVYRGEVLQETLSIPVSRLSPYDRELLQTGILLEDERALRRAIEDFQS